MSRARTPPAPPADSQLSLEARFRPPEVIKPETTALVPAAPTLPAPVEEPRILAVSALVRGARVMLEARFADVRVEGELSGLRRSGNGHLYFVLKDAEAQVDCVMFSREAGRLKFAPTDGLFCRCRGRLTIFEGRGKFQLTITAIEPAGAGALALAFEALKQKLAAEGLFAPTRKRPLPFLPRRIGVVTSPQGAVIRDIVRVAHKRFPVRILLAPAPVQGEGASVQLGAALRQLEAVADVDVIIVARGGGSLEDLWAFNEEPLARAIAGCRVPVISAVGHETDFTIADFVADVRAPTPTAAASLVVPAQSELRDEMQLLSRRLGRGVQGEFRSGRLLLERARARLSDPRRFLDQRRQALDEAVARAGRALTAAVARRHTALRALDGRLLRAHPQRRIADQRAALKALERKLAAAMTSLLTRRRRLLEGGLGKIEALSPLKVLERGYSLVRHGDGRVVASAGDVAAGEPVTITLRDGQVGARVESVSKEKP